MPSGPCGARPGIEQAAAQQQFADPVPAGHQIAAEILAAAHQVPQRLELGLGHDHRAQLPGGEQPRELERVAGVGLDPVTGLARDRARRADHHLDPSRAGRAREPEPGRARFIDRADRPRQRLHPADRLDRRSGDLGLEHLPGPELHRRRGGPPGVHVKPNETDTFWHVGAPYPSMRYPARATRCAGASTLSTEADASHTV